MGSMTSTFLFNLKGKAAITISLLFYHLIRGKVYVVYRVYLPGISSGCVQH